MGEGLVLIYHSANKAVFLQRLSEILVEQGVLTHWVGGTCVAINETEAKVQGEADPAIGIDPMVPEQPSSDSLRLMLQLKEVERETKRLEVEAMHLKIRALELECTTPVSPSPLSTAQLAAQPKLGTRANALPGGVGLTPVFATAQSGFNVSMHIVLVPPFRETEVDSYFCDFSVLRLLYSGQRTFGHFYYSANW